MFSLPWILYSFLSRKYSNNAQVMRTVKSMYDTISGNESITGINAISKDTYIIRPLIRILSLRLNSMFILFAFFVGFRLSGTASNRTSYVSQYCWLSLTRSRLYMRLHCLAESCHVADLLRMSCMLLLLPYVFVVVLWARGCHECYSCENAEWQYI